MNYPLPNPADEVFLQGFYKEHGRKPSSAMNVIYMEYDCF